MSDIRLYMFQSGTQKCKMHHIRMNSGDGTNYEIPVPWFLLTHPKGHTLIDGGLAVEGLRDPRGYWGKSIDSFWPVMAEDEGCIVQLAKLGIQPDEIRYVVQSHLHSDHTGAIGRFPNATHIVQRREYEYAFTPDWFMADGYIRNDFDRPGLKWQFLAASTTDYHDLYGDKTLTIVFTPGHSPGHQSVLIKLANSGPILLAIDAAYTMDHWNEKALPGLLTSTMETVRSVQKLRALVEQSNAMVVTGHDPDLWPQFKKAPHYYD